jgi:hypothetical protein
MPNWKFIAPRALYTIEQNALTFQHILHTLAPDDARRWRDSGDGWTALEVVCHLRDFDGFFHDRAVMIRDTDNPQLPAYDHEAIAVERAYNDQDPTTAAADLVAARGRFVAFFRALDDADWERAGVHPEKAYPFSLADALFQVVTHDATHLEQITRIIREQRVS